MTNLWMDKLFPWKKHFSENFVPWKTNIGNMFPWKSSFHGRSFPLFFFHGNMFPWKIVFFWKTCSWTIFFHGTFFIENISKAFVFFMENIFHIEMFPWKTNMKIHLIVFSQSHHSRTVPLGAGTHGRPSAHRFRLRRYGRRIFRPKKFSAEKFWAEFFSAENFFRPISFRPKKIRPNFFVGRSEGGGAVLIISKNLRRQIFWNGVVGGSGGACPPQESPFPVPCPRGGSGGLRPPGISVNYPCLASAAAVPCPRALPPIFFRPNCFVRIFSSEFFRRNFFRPSSVRRPSVVRPSVVRPSSVRPSDGRPTDGDVR